MISLAEGDFLYIRNQGDGGEELFNRREDPRELTNRARAGAFEQVLDRFRKDVSMFGPDGGRGDRREAAR